MTAPSSGEDTPPTATPAVSGDASTAPLAGSEAKSSAQGMTLEQAQAVIADLRREATQTRTKLSAFEKAQEEAEQAKLSEIEKANKRAADAEARATAQRDLITTQAVEAAALRLGISDPEYAAYKIRKDLQVDDGGLPKNADTLLQAFLKDNPQFAAASARPPVSSGGATNPARSAASGSNVIPPGEAGRRMISSFSESEYDARRAEIQQWLARNPYHPGR